MKHFYDNNNFYFRSERRWEIFRTTISTDTISTNLLYSYLWTNADADFLNVLKLEVGIQL